MRSGISFSASARAAVLGLLAADRDAGGGGLTRKQLWDGLPDDLRRNENRFRQTLEDGAGRLWAREERAAYLGGPVYRPGG